jgi:23S rRNA (adenine2503-C2)-methyltransferase
MDKLLGNSLEQLQEAALSVGLPRFAGKQLAEWIYQKRATTFMEMTNISGKGRQALAERYTIGREEPIAHIESEDGTTKYLFEVQTANGKQFIETVYIPEADRATLCVSTQAGCKMGCRFCMTGTLGFHGNLSTADILNQIFSIPQSAELSNIVYMGEGEPCDNISSTLDSINVLTSSWGCAWSPRRITVSSVGYLPHLKELLDLTDCHIAISLHNPISTERQEIMPIEKAYPMTSVLQLLKQYDWQHQRRLSFEYICFGGKNDTMRHANALRRLLSELNCRINLIRFHEDPQNQHTTLHPSSDEQMVWLRDYLTSNGIITTIRRSRGEDILAACGMLVNSLKDK